jgi:hypothetical protein
MTLNGVMVDVAEVRKALAAHDEQANTMFEIGQWVVNTDPLATLTRTARQVCAPAKGLTGWWGIRVWVDCGENGKKHVDPLLLRPATPDEILAATRIVPKVGMLLEDKEGVVWRVTRTASDGCHLRGLTGPIFAAFIQTMSLSTESYTLRDSVTIQGVR